jgi:hypothetical protein
MFMSFHKEHKMPKRHDLPLPKTIDDLTAAPLAVKDALRGIRRKLAAFTSHIPDLRLESSNQRAQSPLALATVLLNETRKIASLGEDIAKDVVFRHRDEARLSTFARSGLGLPHQERSYLHRHDFVSSRYVALKMLTRYLNAGDPQILEQPIDALYLALFEQFKDNSALSKNPDGVSFDRIALSVVQLEQSDALTFVESNPKTLSLKRQVFAALGLMEAILALSNHSSMDTTLAALHLAADVVVLRKAVIEAIFEGFDPVAQVSAEYRLLAPPLAEA